MNEASELARRVAVAAYEMGWRDACSDFMAQEKDKTHPIGQGKRTESVIVFELDPHDLLGLQP